MYDQKNHVFKKNVIYFFIKEHVHGLVPRGLEDYKH